MMPVKVGIIGCGLAALNNHLPVYQKLRNRFTIACVCDIEEEKARSFARAAGDVPFVCDHRRILANDEIEAVDLILPTHLHCPVGEEVLKAGKHLFVEKPIAANLPDARRMVELDGRYPQYAKIVGENFRYRKALARLRDHVTGGSIGRPYAVFCSLLAPFYLADYAKTPWRRQGGLPGGVVTDVGIHWASQLRLLFGDITVTAAFGLSANAEMGKMDSISFHFASSQGVKGVVNLYLGVRDYFQETMTILGTEGTLVGGQSGPDFGTYKISVHDHGRSRDELFEGDTGLPEEFEDFYQAIRGKAIVKSSFAEASMDLKLILEAVAFAE